jgi:hypothetical protein
MPLRAASSGNRDFEHTRIGHAACRGADRSRSGQPARLITNHKDNP